MSPPLTHPRSGEEQLAKLATWPAIARTFLKPARGGRWRAPRINETCCARPRLAQLLRDVAAQGPGEGPRRAAATGPLAQDVRWMCMCAGFALRPAPCSFQTPPPPNSGPTPRRAVPRQVCRRAGGGRARRWGRAHRGGPGGRAGQPQAPAARLRFWP